MELEPAALTSLIAGPASDPAPVIARLQEGDPVCWLPGLDAWLLTRHEDVRGLFSDPRVTADPRVYERYREPADPRLSQLPFRSATSDTESLGRRLVSAALTPRAVARVENCVREVVGHFAAPLRRRGGCVELIGDFTAPVSATTLGRILGVPPKDEDEIRFRQLAKAATRTIRPFLSERKRQDSEQAGAEIGDYIHDLVIQRRAARGDDFISALVAAADAGPVTTVEDLTRVITGLVAAGTGTTSIAGARALRTLLKHPGLLAQLRRERSLIPAAMNELLRYDSGLIVMPRYVVEDLNLRGRSLKTGQLVVLSLMGANRDPRVFPEPDRVDFRRDTKEALSFGYGVHYCPGANIARLELCLMLEAALDFLPPGAQLLEDQIRWSRRVSAQ
jgi:cytochrome P450